MSAHHLLLVKFSELQSSILQQII